MDNKNSRSTDIQDACSWSLVTNLDRYCFYGFLRWVALCVRLGRTLRHAHADHLPASSLARIEGELGAGVEEGSCQVGGPKADVKSTNRHRLANVSEHSVE